MAGEKIADLGSRYEGKENIETVQQYKGEMAEKKNFANQAFMVEH